MAGLSDMKRVYTRFVETLNDLEQLHSTEIYLVMLEIMKQDIQERQKNCVNHLARPEVVV